MDEYNEEKELEFNDQQLMDMPLVEFYRYIETLPAKYYQTVMGAMAMANGILTAGFSLTNDKLNEEAAKGMLTLGNEEVKNLLGQQYNIMKLFGELKAKSDIVMYFAGEKVPECFKDNKKGKEVN